MIKIYGPERSSAGRCYLLLEECGLTYETVPLDLKSGEHKSEKFLKLNPNGKVPCLIDGDFVIWESMAINQYLAEKYKPELLGKTPEEKGQVMQWSLWSILELQPPMIAILIQMMFTPEDKRDPKVIERAHEKIPGILKILEQQLKGKSFILGDRLTVADFNVASVVNIAGSVSVSLEGFPNITAWMTQMKNRPSFKKFAEKRSQ